MQWNAAQLIANSAVPQMNLVRPVPQVLLLLALAMWWGYLVVQGRRWRRTSEALQAMGLQKSAVNRIFVSAVGRAAVLGSIAGVLIAAAVTWVGAPLLGRYLGQSWSAQIGGRAVLGALGIRPSVDGRTSNWLTQPIPGSGTVLLTTAVLCLASWLMSWVILRRSATSIQRPDRAARARRGSVARSRLALLPFLAAASLLLAGVLLVLSAGQATDGKDAAFSSGRIVTAGFLIAMGLVVMTTILAGRFGRGHPVLARITRRWVSTTLGAATAICLVSATSAGALALISAESSHRKDNYTADQPAESMLISSISSASAQQVSTLWRSATGAEAWTLRGVDQERANVMTSSPQFASCLAGFLGQEYTSRIEEKCPYPRTSKSAPFGTTAVSVAAPGTVGLAAGQGQPGAVLAEPEMITDGAVGLVLLDATKNTILAATQVDAAPVVGLGGNLPSAVVDPSAPALADLRLTGSSLASVLLPDFGALGEEEQATFRASVAPLTAVADSVTQDRGPDGGDNYGFTLGTVILSSFLLIGIVLATAGAVLSSSRPVRALATGMGITRRLQWGIGIRSLGTLLVAPIAGAGAAAAGLLATWSAFSITDLGAWWFVPSAAAIVAVLALVVRMSLPVRRATPFD